MADIVIVAAIAIAAFFIIRNQLRRIRKGGCGCGCAGCSGCGAEKKRSQTQDR
ncbi:MAG TPA: FeoB-associated Cys-rich membrane protein [Candidatus Acetatifactor stercoripullorum]|uniref:FeoB-associated Cys-rich membrane protein n=1 Tax=Candidatus Acetatifactor stercoripullorum TaxID=2838414 RepID=A0A9D1UAT6_9FIRM|nr:FeoB-associated Cys-rich membrane protein [Candidatus Acetatifactor stercoripullorum]HIW80428.1 FeoB-associated Cys-rich membrane protein [Candidatus Acetatifactor stercoripullorum]